MVLFLLLLIMVVRVGINGFGRIGRVIFRTCFQSKDLEVSAINDPAIDIEYICYLIKFDSTHGKFKGQVSCSADNEISIDDKKIKVFCEKLPSNIPWHSAEVQYVVEASGMFTTLEKASGHLVSESVKRVIVTAPTVDVPMLILGVNKEQIKAESAVRFSKNDCNTVMIAIASDWPILTRYWLKCLQKEQDTFSQSPQLRIYQLCSFYINNQSEEQKVISCASSTLYCLAPIVKILEDNYGVVEGFITSIHAMTPSLKPLDGLCLKGKHWRDHRSIHQNIIPAATGACRALGKIIPAVKDKLTGLAFRVPIVNVSVLDITVRLTKNTSIQDIIKCVIAQSNSNMKNIIKISKEQEVSSDFLGDVNSCIFDVNSSLQLNPNFFKLICWYENEHSYACRVVDSIKYSEENRCKLNLSIKTPIGRIISSNQSVHKKPVPDFNKEYIIANLHVNSNPKILSSASEETGLKFKSLEPHVTFERPTPLEKLESSQLALCETKQNNDIFKVWNDEAQSRPLMEEYKNSSVQSCVTSGPAYVQNNNYRKTKERLEEVKKEFSKMVNITENLLKKSNQNELRLEDGIKNNVLKKNTMQEVYNTELTLPTVSKGIPTSGGFQTRFNKLYKDVFIAQRNDNGIVSMINNTSDLDDTSKVHYKRIKQYVVSKSTEICVNSEDIDKKLLAEPQSDSQNDEKLKEQVNTSNANDELVNSKNLRLETTVCNLTKTLCAATVANRNIKPNVSASVGYKTDLGTSNLEIEKLSKHVLHDDLNNLRNIKYNSEVILVNKNNKTPKESDQNGTDLTVTYVAPESSEPENTKTTNRNEIRKKILQGILKILTTDIQEDKLRSPSVVNTNTTISNGDAYKSLDIYDKLDSASGTDSENSFHINEKKSQIIDVTDLNSSAEDLARLDKICRIIEISDEMSDKLFSALDNNDKNIKKKKWSFKDLCERLKLDEFCNDVFGHPSQSKQY